MAAALTLAAATASCPAVANDRLAAAVRDAEQALRRWGYPALAGAAALDNLGVPAPADTMLVAATLAAGRGELRLPWVLTLAVAGTAVGSQLGFALGRRGGRALLRRLPLAPERLARVERLYARWGVWVVVGAPFVEGVRQLNAVTAGTLGLPWRRFTAANLAAALLWAGARVGGVTLVEDHVATILPALRGAKPWLLAAAVAAVAALLWHLRRRRRLGHGEPPAATPG